MTVSVNCNCNDQNIVSKFVPLFQLRSEYQVYYKIGKCISPALPDDVSEELLDFLKRLFYDL